MRTECFYRISNRGRLLFTSQERSTHMEWVDWKPLTVRCWESVLAATEDTSLREEFVWRYVAEKSSLFGGLEETHEGKELSEEAWRRVAESPSPIVHRLLAPVVESTGITSAEESRIEQEAFALFVAQKSYLEDPHPLVKEALWAMSLKERYGISAYQSLADMSYRTLQGFNLIANIYGKAIETKRQQEKAQQDAARAAKMGRTQ